MSVKAIICDFGGVLTSPLMDAFVAFQDNTGITLEQLGEAMTHGTEATGANPLFELECGRITEDRFLDILRDGFEEGLGHRPDLHRFAETYMDALHPNEEMIALMAELAPTHRMALLTNNVREWEPLWRAKLPVDEIFEIVVDSGFVGMRKPDPAIYDLTLARLQEDGGIEPGECLFIDDTIVNIDAARELGWLAVHHVDNATSIPEIRSHLDA